MDQNEIVLRAIGILTESKDMFSTLNRDADAEYETSGAIGNLLQGAFPRFEIPADATAQEAGQAVLQGAFATTLQLVSAFTFLFSELADVNDAGPGNIKSADVLRELALRFSNPSADDDA